MHTIKDLKFYTMTPYDAHFKNVTVLFPKENVADTLGEYLSKLGKKQLHTAETEKYAHVTFFFNGGREEPYEGEDRILVPSPKVATYDLKPEMSAFEVKDKLVAAIKEDKYDFIVVNFANGDMVGHTGVIPAVITAIEAVDEGVGRILAAADKYGYLVCVTADHGNADQMLETKKGKTSIRTAHSLNPVPFIVYDPGHAHTFKGEKFGLANVAPTLLKLMDLEAPASWEPSML
jgi:2,3-bisphosphoglycerate-independent phosphoglycerate mutase